MCATPPPVEGGFVLPLLAHVAMPCNGARPPQATVSPGFAIVCIDCDQLLTVFQDQKCIALEQFQGNTRSQGTITHDTPVGLLN